MLRPLILALALAAATGARAECPDTPDWQPLDMLQPGDQWLDLFWMNANLPGQHVHYEGSDEYYLADGRYRFEAGALIRVAPGYRFYDGGARCVDYPDGPRFDYYILSHGRLTLLNQRGERYVGLLTY